MAYTSVTGTSANNFMFFQGIEAFYNAVLVNPYSGHTVRVSAPKNINNAIYDGLGGNDTLGMTTFGDVLTLADSFGTIMVKNIEYFNAGEDGDIIILAHETYSYGNAVIRGSNGDDIIWSNNGNDVVQGGAGNDILDGGGGNDIMTGNDGDDYIAGGTGNDTYTFVLGDGSDTVVETSGTDVISFGVDIDFSMLHFSVNGLDLQITYGSAIITIQNHYAADLSGRVETIQFWDQSTFNLIGFVPNDAPVAAADTIEGLRNAVVTGNVLADNGSGADTDVNGDVLSVVASTFTTAQGGVVELLADGSFTYTPATNFYGVDSFEYTLQDGRGGTDTGIVSLTINIDPTDSIIGTHDTDTITGTNGDDNIFGLDGDDVLYGDDGILGGTTLDKVFSDTVVIPELKEQVNIANLKPSGVPALGVAEGNLTVDFDATATITFRDGKAGNNNSFGTFGIAADGTIVMGTMQWANVKTAGYDTLHEIDLPVGADGGTFGFFILSDGNTLNGGYSGLNITGEGNIHFIVNYGKKDARDAKITDKGNHITVVYDDGVTQKVLGGTAFFSTERGDSTQINKDNKTHVVSGMRDLNNLVLDIKKTDLASKPSEFTKNGITLSASTGTLVAPGDGKIGIKSATAGGDIIAGNEVLHASFAGSERVIISLSDIAGNGSAITLKLYLDGDTSNPVFYSATGTVTGGKLDIVIDAGQFGDSLITGFDVSSATETFWVTNIRADIPGGIDTNQIRIGFEDLWGLGDADYEDVLFDLDINPVHVPDAEGGNDFLDGGAGNDILYGEGGNDILIIGNGLDQAWGGEGSDTFAITMIDGLIDIIHDFNAAEGDTIDIADVLEGYDALSSDIADFIQLVQNGANTEIRINADGDAGGEFVAAAMIVGHVDSLATLVQNSAIIADHGTLS